MRFSRRALSAIATSALIATTAMSMPALADTGQPSSDKGAATYIRGVAVKAGNGTPIPGVLVTIRDIDDLSVVGSDVTNSNGVYRIDGLTEDEYAVKFNGRSVGFEIGFLACNKSVVPTWGQACSFGTGNLGQARLQRL
jgi:hypothetical protein